MSPQHCTWLRKVGLTRIKKLVPQHGNTLTRSCVADCAGKPQWAVIMSRGSKYTKQVIEVDFQYPSEGIHYHWDRGEICHGLRKCSIGQRRAAIITTWDGGTHCRSALGRICAAVRLKSVRWCTGFRISCVGASRDQTVVVLSMERGPGREDVTQETLRTSDFPVKASATPSKDRAPYFEIATTNAVLVRGMVWRMHSKRRLPI